MTLRINRDVISIKSLVVDLYKNPYTCEDRVRVFHEIGIYDYVERSKRPKTLASFYVVTLEIDPIGDSEGFPKR